MKKISAIFLLLIVFFAGAGVTVKHTAVAQTSAQSMIIINAENNQVLFEKNAYQKLAMASTTKILTAITVLEYCRLNDIIKVDAKAVGIEGSSIYLQKDEELTVQQILYGLMLQSGNDCAAALAIHCAGSIEEFASLMNKVAKKAGASDSNFVTPHGLDHKDHYTTAYDLAIISAYAMKNEDFRNIVATKKIEIPWQGREYNRVIVNKNKILNRYDGGNGIKTGFTKKAGRCLVSSAKRNELELICVVLNCGPMFEDSMEYMDMVFKKYHIQIFISPYEYLGKLKLNNNEPVHIYAKQGFRYAAEVDDKNFTAILEIDKKTAPLKKDEVIGKIKIYHFNDLIFCAVIYTMDSIEELSFHESLLLIFKSWTLRENHASAYTFFAKKICHSRHIFQMLIMLARSARFNLRF